MHGFDARPVQQADGSISVRWSQKSADDPGSFRAPAEGGQPNLIKPLRADQMHRAGGLIDATGKVLDQKKLYSLISALAARINDESGRLQAVPDNEDIASGYVYLLQFLAHDLVDTAIAASIVDGKMKPAFANIRSRPLRLDTLFGANPEARPHAYAYGPDQRAHNGQVPRLKLRIGPRYGAADNPPRGRYCPNRDIGRAEKPRAADHGAEIGIEYDRPTLRRMAEICKDMAEENFNKPRLGDSFSALSPNLLTEPQLADIRNDVHAMLSQLTVLFQLLHNHIIDRLAPIATDGHERVQAFRHYYCARSVVEILYRHIIEKDVLPRILDAAVLKRYSTREPLWGGRWSGVPIEFSFGAFRFAHSMPRDGYRVSEINDEGSLGDAMLRCSTRSPSARPMTRNWLIDWVYFFPLDARQQPNFSRRIGPHYATDLTQSDDFPAAGEGLTEPGLVTRDLASASLAGLLSVPALIEKMRSVFGHDLIEDFATWRPKIRHWLMQGDRPVPAAQADLIADDPPLAFFVMFEAQYSGAEGPDGVDVPLRGGGSDRINGKRLGPLGSAIVAETIFGALAEASFEFESPDVPVTKRIALCAKAMYGKTHDDAAVQALKSIPDIDSMPDLIRFLKDAGEF